MAISISNDLFASGMEMLARSVAAFRVATRLASAPTIRCCAACLIEVRSNFRLPIVPTNAASEAMPLFRTQSAAEQTSLAPHDSKARLRPVTNRRDSWRSHVHRTHTAQRVQSFKIKTANVRGQGAEPLAFSWGFKGAILSRERMAPFIRTPCAAAGNPLAPYGAAILTPAVYV